jgi:glycosyltransferase involved in cell wall biosynthesis
MKNNRITIMLAIDRMIIGGAEQQLLELAKGIDKNRFKPIVVTLCSGGALEPEVKNIPGIEYICLNRKSKYDFSALLAVLRILRQKHVDIIQPFLTPATFFVLLPAVISRTPVRLVTERGSLMRPGCGYNLYLRIEDFFTRFADRVIPNSESGKRFLIERGINPARIKVIYNGINSQRLTPDPTKLTQIRDNLGLPKNGVLIGISASLTPNKDHATFLRAAQLISHVIPQARFAVLGDGPLRPDLEGMARELGIESNVIFMGNQKEVGPYLSIFDIACLCSVEGEGCSNAILEAMLLCKPVIATDVRGNRELVEDRKTGLLIQVRDPQALANAVLSCLRQPDWAQEMGNRAREMVLKRFSLDRMVSDYETLYEELIKLKRIRNYVST